MNKDTKDTLLKIVLAVIIAMALSALCCGCVTRKVLNETVSQASDQWYRSEGTDSLQASGSLFYRHTEDSTTDTETETVIEIYDTDCRPDSVTGERPLKARTTIKQKSVGRTAVRDSVEANTSAVSVDSTKVEQGKADSTESAVESETKRNGGSLIWSSMFWLLIGVAAVVGVAGYFLVIKK